MEAIATAENTYQMEVEQISTKHEALVTAWSKHSPMLYRIAFRKLRNPEDAEDALHRSIPGYGAALHVVGEHRP